MIQANRADRRSMNDKASRDLVSVIEILGPKASSTQIREAGKVRGARLDHRRNLHQGQLAGAGWPPHLQDHSGHAEGLEPDPERKGPCSQR